MAFSFTYFTNHVYVTVLCNSFVYIILGHVKMSLNRQRSYANHLATFANTSVITRNKLDLSFRNRSFVFARGHSIKQQRILRNSGMLATREARFEFFLVETSVSRTNKEAKEM